MSGLSIYMSWMPWASIALEAFCTSLERLSTMRLTEIYGEKNES